MTEYIITSNIEIASFTQCTVYYVCITRDNCIVIVAKCALHIYAETLRDVGKFKEIHGKLMIVYYCCE